jgi:hypothetical protein
MSYKTDKARKQLEKARRFNEGVMTQHKATLGIDKTGRAFIECAGASDHLPHKIEVTSGVNAIVRLTGTFSPPKTGNIYDALIHAVIADFWKNSTDGNGIEKNELRNRFPGMGGDILNTSLTRLLASRAITQGSCECCYGLPSEGSYWKPGKIEV